MRCMLHITCNVVRKKKYCFAFLLDTYLRLKAGFAKYHDHVIEVVKIKIAFMHDSNI